MRKRDFWVILLAVALAASCAGPATQQAETTEADVDAVRNVVDDLIAAANTNDAEGVLELLCDDLEAIPPGEQPVTGARAHQLFRGFFEEFIVRLEPSTIEIVVSGDWAFRRYAYELTLTPKAGGDAIIERGHGIHMFRRQDDGSWCLAKDIWTRLPPAPDET